MRYVGLAAILVACGSPAPSSDFESSGITPAGHTGGASQETDDSPQDNPQASGEADDSAQASATDPSVPDPIEPPADGDDVPGGLPTVDTARTGEIPCFNDPIVFDPPFDLTQETPEDAFWMMWFSWRALYSEDAAVPVELALAGFTRYRAINVRLAGLQAFVTTNDEVVVVAFRGSQEIADWLTNFSFPQVDADDQGLPGRAHAGFATSIASGWARIEAAVRALGGEELPVFVTGQSLGGAMAVLAAARLHDAGFDLAPVYTFANPRALDEEAAAALHERLGGRVYRYVNERDVVPRLPPWGGASEQAGPVLPLGEDTLSGWVEDLDYAHVGQPFHHRDEQWSTHAPMDDSEDVTYWGDLDAEGWAALLALPGQGREHDRGTYLCILRDRAGLTP